MNEGTTPIISPKAYILKLLLRNLPDKQEKSEFCEEYFNLLTHLMKQCSSSFKYYSSSPPPKSFKDHIPNRKFDLDDGNFSSLDLLSWCVYQLKFRPTYEDRYSSYTDKILGGYL
jgi:hypothetical protein